MGALAASTKWMPEDDLLLKNAVEAGASLESLAKGAVHFSRRYTLNEIYGRWWKLLYDPDTSAEASALIIKLETELHGTNPPKSYRTSLFKGKDAGKRKSDTVRNLYYAFRKRVCCEPPGSDDSIIDTKCEPHFSRFGNTEFQQHFVPHDEHLVGFDGADKSPGFRESYLGYYNGLRICDNMEGDFPGMLMADYGDCRDYSVDFLNPKNMDSLEDELLVGDCIFEYSQDEQCALMSTVYEAESTEQLPSGKNYEKGGIKAVHEKPSCCGTLVRVQPEFADVHFNSQIKESSNLFDELRQTPEECFSFIGDFEANQLLNTSIASSDEVKDMDSQKCHGDGPKIVNVSISEGELNNSKTLSIFEDFSTSYMNFEVDVLLSDVDEKKYTSVNPPGKMKPHDDVVDPSEIQLEGLDVGSETFCDKEHVVSDVLDQVPSVRFDDDRASIAGFDMLSNSLNISQEAAIDEGFMFCVINTEDPEIPCNNHILPSFKSEDLGHNHLGKEAELGFSNECKASFLRSDSCLTPSCAAIKFKSLDVDDSKKLSICELDVDELKGSALPDLKKEILPLLDSGKLVNNGASKIKSAQRCGSAFMGKANYECEADSHFKHQRCCQSKSDQESILSENEEDVPNFSDIETMILDMDLDPNDQDSSVYSTEAARYQCSDTRKALISLERGYLSSIRRATSFHGALAILYGRHVKYFIRTPKVWLGRATEAVTVDIDLGREGQANAISRRQAIITMEDGAFFLTNMGKCSIFINNKEVPKQKCINLISGCLIEIRGMKFTFEANQDMWSHHLVHSRQIKKTSKKFNRALGAVGTS